MNEIPKILEPKEKVIYEGKPEFVPYAAGAILGTLVIVGFIGILIGLYFQSFLLAVVVGAVIFVLGAALSFLAYECIHYAITNKRAIIQSGIIGRDFKSIDYDMMQNVSVDVGVLGVIFKVGTIKLFTGEMETVGGKHPKMQPKYDRFVYVASPYDVLKKLQTFISTRKEKLA